MPCMNQRGADRFRLDEHQMLGWKMKVLNVLASTAGENSSYYKEFSAPVSVYTDHYEEFKRLGAIFSAAKEDLEGGYLVELKNIVQAELFESQLDQAQELLNKGFILPSAVVAGIVLETALRELCDREGLPHASLKLPVARLRVATDARLEVKGTRQRASYWRLGSTYGKKKAGVARTTPAA